MIKSKTIAIISSVFILGSCSGMFEKDESPRLEGERISVLELQNKLTPDANLKSGQKLIIPDSWTNSSWPQAGGYPNHSMQNPSLSGIDSKLKRAWSADIGSGGAGDIPLTATPIVVNGAIYALDTDSKLSAFSAQTGKKIWKISVKSTEEDENVISGGISFAHDTLFVTNGYDEVLAISPQQGEIKWRKNLPAPSRAAPTVINGRVFVSTIDSRLIALNAEDGASLWEYRGISETTGLLGAASPAANSDIVVSTFSSGEITALRVENGSVAWSDNLSNVRRYGGGLESLSDIKAMPILGNSIVIAISFGGKLAAIDERTGARVWQREISGSQTPWIVGEYIYIISSDNQLIALNSRDGSIIWIKELGSFKNNNKKDTIQWSGPIMASGQLIVTGSHGNILKVNAHNGEILQTIKTKKKIQISPIIANDTLYILSKDGTLLAYR